MGSGSDDGKLTAAKNAHGWGITVVVTGVSGQVLLGEYFGFIGVGVSALFGAFSVWAFRE